MTVTQRKKTNKLIINLKSYSYRIQRPVIYYLIFNETINVKMIFSALAEAEADVKNLNKSKKILKFEDHGENKNFQTEIDMDKELLLYDDGNKSSTNKMFVVPVDKETNLLYTFSDDIFLNYDDDNEEKKEEEPSSGSGSTLVIIIVSGILVLVIIIGLLLLYKKKRKENSNDFETKIDTNERILAED